MEVFVFLKTGSYTEEIFAAFIFAVPVSICRQLASLLVYKFVINFKFTE